MVDRLVMSGVMQTQIGVAEQRIADDIRKRRVYWRAGPEFNRKNTYFSVGGKDAKGDEKQKSC